MVVWFLQWIGDSLHYWSTGLWFMLFGIPGVGLYMRTRDSALTSEAARARSYYENLAKPHVKTPIEALLDYLEIAIKRKAVRYPLAIVCLIAAYYVGTGNFSDITDETFWAIALCVAAALCAYEIALWSIGIAVAAGIAWWLFSGIAAIPVSVAVIIGALIIASAVSGKK